MFSYYLKSALKHLNANKKFSAINIIGFAFGISVCLAIALYLINEYSFDRYHEHTDQIVRLYDTEDNTSFIDYRVKDLVLENFPETEYACLVQLYNRPLDINVNGRGTYIDGLMSVDNGFFQVFSIQFITGNSMSPFENLNSAVITENTATELFGTENPLGKELLVFNRIPVIITGIIKDFPDNSSFSADLLVNAENDDFKLSVYMEDSRDRSTYRWPFLIYLQLNEQVDEEQFLAKLNANAAVFHPYVSAVGFLPLKDQYLHDTTGLALGNTGLLTLLTIIASVILGLAVINYVNLSIAQQGKRNKGTGLRKTFGADRSNILIQFLTESVLVTLMAFVIAIFLVRILLPFYESVLNTTIDMSILLHWRNLLILAGAVLLIGCLSGCIPALVISRIRPVRILSDSWAVASKKSYTRNVLTIFQFTISIILIFSVIIVQRQVQFVKHKNPGFNEEQLLKVDIPRIQEDDYQTVMAFAGELRKSPYVKDLSLSQSVPGEIRQYMGSNIEGSDKNMSVPCILADTSFLQTFGIRVIQGRNLEPGDYGKVCMFNEAAYKHFEFENLENKRFNNFGGFDIIGVVNDFHFCSLHDAIGPVCIMFTPRSSYASAINIRFQAGGAGPGMDYINDLWEDMLTAYPLSYEFYDDWFDSMYRTEERFAKAIGIFAALAVVISCIGILGLAIFSAERRVKEIGIRKVNGAMISEVMIMLNKDYVKWVGIAFVIATPIAYYAMNKWLQNFAYKTVLSWWVFALPGLLALVIALLTVSWQSYRSASRNPVEALRYE